MRYSARHERERYGPLDQLAALAEPVRRRLYDYVVGQPAPVDRDEAALALEIGRPLAAFHLDRLVDGGLLTANSTADRAGRPGRRPASEVLPPRAPAMSRCRCRRDVTAWRRRSSPTASIAPASRRLSRTSWRQLAR